MKKLLIGALVAAALMLGLAAPDIVAQNCTATTNLGLCKGARGASEWDVFLNSNFDLIDSLTINTGSGSQTKAGTLTLSNVSPLKLTGTGYQGNDVLFLGTDRIVSRSSDLQWDGTKLSIGSGYVTTGGVANLLGLTISTGAGTGKVLTSDGSGNATWQTVSGAASGWTPGTGKVTLTTATDEVGIGVASPTERLEIAGGIKLDAAQTTQAGVIQWNGSHFQGYTGSTWVDLDYTSSSAGGWTDGGASLTLTTLTDYLGIGVAANPNYKILVSSSENTGAFLIYHGLTGASTYSMIEGISQWNVGSYTPTLLKFDIVDTSSGSASKFMEFLLGGSSRFSFRKDGQLTMTGGLIATTGTFSGALSATAITLSSGASNGYILTSDASGNASWQASAAGAGIPSGMIAIFDTSCPGGWTRMSAYDSRVILPFPTAGVTGGSDVHQHAVDPTSFSTDYAGTHSHTVPMGTFTTDLCSNCDERVAEPGTKGVASYQHSHPITIPDRQIQSTGSHTHSIDVPSTMSALASSYPPYITAVFCKKN